MGAPVEQEPSDKVVRFRQSAALLRQLTEHAAVPTFLVNNNGDVFYANAAFCRLLGYEPDEVTGLGIGDIVCRSDATDAREQVAQLASGEIDGYRAERRYLRKSGGTVWVSANASVLRDERTGRPLYLIVQALDIDRQKKAEAALVESESRWNFALESARQGVWDHDNRNQRAFFSRVWRQLRGFDADEEVDGSPEGWMQRVHPDDRERILDIIRRQATGEISAHEYEYRERHKDGHWIWILSRGKVIERGTDGRPLRVLGTDTDITHLKEVEAELAGEKERFRVALESIGDGVVSTDAGGLVTFMNPIAEHLTGWRAADARGKPLTQVFTAVADDTGEPAADPVAACLARGDLFRRESDVLLVSRTGERHDIRDSAAPLKRDGEVIGAVLVFHDVTASRALQRELAHSAMHDPLTGLPNRAAFDSALQNASEQARRELREHALCFLDVDRFKAVNDRAGHAAGDELLQEIARVIRRGCRAHDIAARIGGDEFALLLPDCSLIGGRRVAEGIIEAIASLRFSRYDKTHEIGASVGITPITSTSPSPETLMSQADAACYAAKEKGRNQVALYDENTDASERVDLIA